MDSNDFIDQGAGWVFSSKPPIWTPRGVPPGEMLYIKDRYFVFFGLHGYVMGVFLSKNQDYSALSEKRRILPVFGVFLGFSRSGGYPPGGTPLGTPGEGG